MLWTEGGLAVDRGMTCLLWTEGGLRHSFKTGIFGALDARRVGGWAHVCDGILHVYYHTCTCTLSFCLSQGVCGYSFTHGLQKKKTTINTTR